MSHHFHERKLNNDAARHHHEEVCLPLVGYGHNAQLDHVEHSRRIKERKMEKVMNTNFKGKLFFSSLSVLRLMKGGYLMPIMWKVGLLLCEVT